MGLRQKHAALASGKLVTDNLANQALHEANMFLIFNMHQYAHLSYLLVNEHQRYPLALSFSIPPNAQHLFSQEHSSQLSSLLQLF